MCLEDEFKSVEEQYFSDCLEECLPIVSDESDAFSSPEVSEALQLSLQDIEEEQTLSQFLEKPCCTNGCTTVIPEERIVFARNNFLELQKDLVKGMTISITPIKIYWRKSSMDVSQLKTAQKVTYFFTFISCPSAAKCFYFYTFVD